MDRFAEPMFSSGHYLRCVNPKCDEFNTLWDPGWEESEDGGGPVPVQDLCPDCGAKGEPSE